MFPVKGDEDYDEYLTTTEAPGIAYSVEVKLVELGENFKLPKAGSLQYTDLTNSIEENFKPLFNKLPGYRRVVVENIKPDDRNLVAAMNLQLERPLADKARALAEDTSAMDEKVKRVVRESISSGRIGNLKVDPQYLVIEPQKYISNAIPDASSTKEDGFFNLSEAKLYIVLGCIGALVLVAIIQAGCTIYRATARSSANHKRVYSVQLDPVYYRQVHESLPHYALTTMERNRQRWTT
ncbi:unnamed protein product [Callosobruchus maculatus]|uniref:SEA domain-containing protein n=1 Tax=Callosobruchus maculatus TaxID=64391 RepID=A0A653C440_CALMS|nr:unnamed protein product [Callosobruchus maculatus]